MQNKKTSKDSDGRNVMHLYFKRTRAPGRLATREASDVKAADKPEPSRSRKRQKFPLRGIQCYWKTGDFIQRYWKTEDSRNAVSSI
jgi:hypothetical protein